MSRRAFTLIELLVVIAIIALLIAILVSSLQNLRQHAKAVLCSSNVKQLVLGLAMYETENETFPYGFHFSPNPPPGGYAGNFMYDRIGWWWFNYISSDYTGGKKGRKGSLWCPSRRIKDPKFGYVLHGNYGVNQSICKSKSSSGRKSHAEFAGTPLGSVDISRPGETILIVDSGYSMITWWHTTDTPPMPLGNIPMEDTAYIPGLRINRERTLWPSQEWDARDGRHPNKTVNVGFADGHVNRTKADELFVEKIAEDYRNKSLLWQPK